MSAQPMDESQATEHIFEIGDYKLECKDKLPVGSLMRVAAEGGDTSDITAVAKLMKSLVKPHELERLWDAIDEHGVEGFETSFKKLVESYTGPVPTKRLSSSSAGSTPTPQKSRVVSLSRGTVVEQPMQDPA